MRENDKIDLISSYLDETEKEMKKHYENLQNIKNRRRSELPLIKNRLRIKPTLE